MCNHLPPEYDEQPELDSDDSGYVGLSRQTARARSQTKYKFKKLTNKPEVKSKMKGRLLGKMAKLQHGDGEVCVYC